MADLVPTIDLSSWWIGDTEGRRALAADVDEACRTVGFLRIAGHGIRASLIERMLTVTTSFFDLPSEEKERYVPPSPERNRGYARRGSEALAYSIGDTPASADLFEAFNMGVDRWPRGDPYYESERDRLFARNIWPNHPTVMRDVWIEYFDAVQEVGDRLMDVFALALGLPEDFFGQRCARAPNVMRAINYERLPSECDAKPGQMRMGAHSDYGACTLLLADGVPGLQMMGPDGEWHDVAADPGTLVVNLGDLLAQWTNDRWKSTLHRVVPPPATTTGPFRRRSIAFFHEVDHDAVVTCLPTCTSRGNPPKYSPITAGEHLRAKLMGPRTLSPSIAMSTLAGRRVV
jgi:isopenicillin N synthase-like dioxygenase